MEKSLISLLFLGVLAAQNPVSVTFDHLPTDAELPPMSPACSTTLTASATNSALTLTVTSSACFLISQLVTIETETMQVSAIPDSTHLTIGTGTRGYAGTTAASHANGKTVAGGISSFNHNSTNAWLKSIATAVGARNPAVAGFVDLYPPSDATNKIGWQAPATRSTPIRLVLPAADPTAGQALVCGAPSSGESTCSWTTPGSGGGGTSNKYAATISGTSTSITAATHGLGSTVIVNGCKDGSGGALGVDFSIDGSGNVTITSAVSQAGTCYLWGQSIYAAAISGTSTSITAATHGLGTSVVVSGCKDGSGNSLGPDYAIDGSGNVTITSAVSQSGTCYLR